MNRNEARDRRPDSTPADERDVEARLSDALARIAEDARRDPAQYARETEVPDGGE